MASAEGQPEITGPKLSLVARKSVREKWEPEKIKLEQKLQDLLGGAWIIALDAVKFNQVLSQEHSRNFDSELGSECTRYATKAIEEIEGWVKEYLGAEEINELFPSKIFSVNVGDGSSSDELAVKDSTGALSLRVDSASFDKNIHPRKYRNSISSCCNEASKEKDGSQILPPETRRSIRAHYDPKIEEVREKLGKVLEVPDIKLDPNFEGIIQYEWPKDGVPPDTLMQLGRQCHMYFESFLKQMVRLGFGSDEMLREGFKDCCPSHEIGIKLVPKKRLGETKPPSPVGTINDVAFEDGKLWIRTCPEYWWSNQNQVGETIIDEM